jgi:beta-glucosidase
MTAYNGVNGLPCTANRWLLTDLLRGEWGFDGAVVTDWGAPRCIRTAFNLVPTDEHVVKAALEAGVDVLCQYDGISEGILAAVRGGVVEEWQLDEALCRSLKVLFRLGMFDPPERVPYEQITPAWLGRPEHIALAREASRESIVLLKNEAVPDRADPTPLLPLDRRKLESIAVVGSHANRVYLGAYSGEPSEPAVTTLRGVSNHLSDRVVVRDVPWVRIDDSSKNNQPAEERRRSVDAAIQAGGASDVALVVVGLNSKYEDEGRDRTDLDLPKDQQEFVEKIVAVNPATVVVLIHGGPLAINWIQQHAPAIVDAWYPGEQGGNAIADVLFGDYNPAGRLPMTFYASLAQLPPLDNYEINLGRTYQYLLDPPLYPFGHGLSYTRFDYRNLHLDRSTVATNGTINMTVDVSNTGPRDGDEVVQLYIRHVAARVPMPLQQLRGFRRVHIPQGQTRPVSFAVKAADLGYWSEARPGWVVEPGEIEVRVGASSTDIRAQATFSVR